MSVIHKSATRHCNKSMTMKTTTNAGKIQKYSRKVREESVGAISNKLFSENCMYDPRNLFFKINANINIKTMCKDSKRNHNYEKNSNFFLNYEKSCIELITHIVRRRCLI